MSNNLIVDDICEMFHKLTEIEIQASILTIRSGNKSDMQMGQGYILAIERARTILRLLIKDVK